MPNPYTLYSPPLWRGKGEGLKQIINLPYPYTLYSPPLWRGKGRVQTNIIMAKVIEGLYYSESHEYVKVEGEYGYVGITDYAQEQLGNVVYVDMPEVDDEVTAGEDFGAVESVKAASDLISPVSGVVVEINADLEDQPELINQDAFGTWIMKVKLSDPSEVDNLLSAADYENCCK